MPVFSPDSLDIQPLLTRTMERDNESTQDHETDDEEPSDCSYDDEVREGCDGSAPTNNACIYAENDGGHPDGLSSASATWQKWERSTLPAAATPPKKKSKSAKKHKKARIERAAPVTVPLMHDI